MNEMLSRAYGLIAELLVHPDERDEARVVAGFEALDELPRSLAEPLRRFREAPEAMMAQEYVQVLELNPPCPLYLGAHLFDEPRTCRGAGASGRNGYMLELRSLYRHFGLEADARELPDHVPLVVEFLGLSLGSQVSMAGQLRRYLLEELVRPALEPMETKLREYDTVFQWPMTALRDAVDRDLIALEQFATWVPANPDEVVGMRCDERLANITQWLATEPTQGDRRKDRARDETRERRSV